MNTRKEQQHGTDGQPKHSCDPGREVDLDAIPEELRKLDRWVCWQHATRDGKLTKVPKYPEAPHP